MCNQNCILQIGAQKVKDYSNCRHCLSRYPQGGFDWLQYWCLQDDLLPSNVHKWLCILCILLTKSLLEQGLNHLGIVSKLRLFRIVFSTVRTQYWLWMDRCIVSCHPRSSLLRICKNKYDSQSQHRMMLRRKSHFNLKLECSIRD